MVFGSLHTLFILMVAIGATISGWIVTIQVRRRIRKALGKKASDLELVSLRTWMQVEEAEKKKQENLPIRPR